MNNLYDHRETGSSYIFQSPRSDPHTQGTRNSWERNIQDIHLSELAATEVYARISGDDTAAPLAKLGQIMGRVEKAASENSIRV